MFTTLVRNTALAAATSTLLLASASPTLARQHLRAVASGMPTFSMSVFARGTKSLYNPDGIIVTKNFIFIDYQNASDTVPSVPSTIAKYDRAGNLVGTVSFLGRSDGMRLDPFTKKIWALINNDGLNGSPPRQPALIVVDPTTLGTTTYAFSKTQPHGGGYDDLAFVGGKAFISASSPTLSPGGINNNPVIQEVFLFKGKALIRPILNGVTTGYDIPSQKTIQLNIADPDSMAVDTKGNLVLVSEGDQQLVIVSNPGTSTQSVSHYFTPTDLDEIAFANGKAGTYYIADTALNIVYAVTAQVPAGTVLVEATAGGKVQSFIGTLDRPTGIVTPLLTQLQGIVDPTALVFSDGSEPAI